MIIYIKNNVSKKFIILETELDKTLYSNIGNSFEDYLHGAWVKLSDEQVQFYLSNQNASVEEVWNTQLNQIQPETNELEQAKLNMLNTIDLYDKSNAVNGFVINDTIIAWFTVEQRLNYKQSVESAKLLGETQLTFLVNNALFSIDVVSAEYMLAQIQRYADNCYMVTEYHKNMIKNMTDVDQINQYDFMTGYPERLKFNL